MTKKIAQILLILSVTMFFTAVTPLVDITQAYTWNEFANDLGDVFSGGDSTDVTSFTEFTGGLSAPSTEGYAEGLTQATDARQFILSVTNFALGFLGLLAILIVIYGGFLYLTSAGEPDKAEKGKKSVTYAIIGIILILGSFAIVNTVLQAPGGDDRQGAGGSSATSGTRSFNVMAAQIEQMAKDVVTGFVFHWDASKYLFEAKALIDSGIKRITDCRDAATWSESKCGDNWGDGLEASLNVANQAFRDANSRLSMLKQQFPSGEVESIAIRDSIDKMISHISNVQSRGMSEARAEADSNGCNDNLLTEPCDATSNRSVYYKYYTAGIETIEAQFKETYDTVNNQFQSIINQQKNKILIMYNLVGDVLSSGVNTNLETAFSNLVDSTYMKSNTALLAAQYDMKNVAGSLKQLDDAVIAQDTKNVSPTDTSISPYRELKDVIQHLGVLHGELLNIQFIDVRLTASVVEGNAPLIVNFSTVGSTDPSGKTIDPSQIEWDLDGDNNYSLKEVKSSRVAQCNESNLIATTCTFLVPGTYPVKVKIKPANADDAAKIVPGLATLNIRVNPPQTKVNLKINELEGLSGVISEYNENGVLEINRNTVIVPYQIASSGLTFDATKTISQNEAFVDQAKEGATVYWDFGDDVIDNYNKVILESSAANMTATHKYAEEGNYTVTVEFSNKDKIIDRKIFNLIVARLAPQMAISNFNPMVGDVVTFDGSNSISERGAIKSFKWIFSPAITGVNLEQDKHSYSFTDPGDYSVSLEIFDGEETAKTPDEIITVKSQPPVSQFAFDIPKSNQPATIYLDGTRSYDPDGPKTKFDYKWEVNGQELVIAGQGTGSGYTYNQTDKSKPTVSFSEPGTYSVTLTVIDQVTKEESKPFEKDIYIDKTIDVDWGNTTSTGVIQQNPSTGIGAAEVKFNLVSKNGIAYEIDYGDGEVEQGEMNQSVNLSHEYTQAGTYLVTASVFDAQDKENNIKKKVYISSGNAPAAVAGIKVNGEELFDTVEPIFINRTDVITLSAANSINTDGTGRRLSYSWDFGDGTKSTTESANHTYSDIGEYNITLKVTNANDITQTATDNLRLTVKGEPPFIRSISAVPTNSNFTTPVTVSVNAIGAEDPDGTITTYRWWYFDPNNDQDQMGVQVTTSPSATLTIGTRGDEGQQKTYKFGVEITDNENNTVRSGDILPDQFIPTLTVTNGPNKAPTAKFTVDRTSIFVGETINFASQSTDPDGQITGYFWDWEGDGFANNNKNEGATVSHRFDTAAPNGLRIRLKVKDNNESEAVSDAVTIYVDSIAQPPKANFSFIQDEGTMTVKFANTSTSDTAAGATLTNYAWDFDIYEDTNNDGVKDNDTDSVEKDPVHKYSSYGIKRARLIVTDSEGATATITNFVNVKQPVQPLSTTLPTTQQLTATLDARLLTVPAPNPADNKVHLKGTSGSVTLDFSTSVGDIILYSIDSNIFFDSNGNGIQDDDADFTSTKPEKWTTTFSKSASPIRVRLTVTDKAGKKDSVDKDIVFDTNTIINN